MDKIILESNIIPDSYVNYVAQAYDIQNTDTVQSEIFDFNLHGGDWNIGLIYGNSGSGKTSILKNLSGGLYNYEFNPNLALISNFKHVSEVKACRILSSVGLSSVPSWLKPYPVLSNGEQFRARMAMELSFKKNIHFIDEFTSVVNRDVAKSTSTSISKFIRRENKKVVFASCHDDIIPWLQPDWIFNSETGNMSKKKSMNDQDPEYFSTSMREPRVHGKRLNTIII